MIFPELTGSKNVEVRLMAERNRRAWYDRLCLYIGRSPLLTRMLIYSDSDDVMMRETDAETWCDSDFMSIRMKKLRGVERFVLMSNLGTDNLKGIAKILTTELNHDNCDAWGVDSAPFSEQQIYGVILSYRNLIGIAKYCNLSREMQDEINKIKLKNGKL